MMSDTHTMTHTYIQINNTAETTQQNEIINSFCTFNSLLYGHRFQFPGLTFSHTHFHSADNKTDTTHIISRKLRKTLLNTYATMAAGYVNGAHQM